ncbi:MAG: NUDIX domain-containing protein [Pseudomonadales bacterium]|nr:NUDIX domain-containing protein [Pseudomonadales bacterium]MCP5183777.1 NUDIX domain-containing protein [Pseudomonadales bacterium]
MEYFDTFDVDGTWIGQAPRAEVHARGYWHRSAHVFLFDGDGRMLLQRRAADKDLYPGRWDYAVGEHLRSGESYRRGAARGLCEELGLFGLSLQPLGALFAEPLTWPGGVDCEFQQAFVTRHDGPVTADGVEVVALRWTDREALRVEAAESPHNFTPWFLRELGRLRVIENWPAVWRLAQSNALS